MIRAFSPRDVLRLHRRQAVGSALDHEGLVLSGRSPLQHALGSLVPGRRGPYRTWLLEPEDASLPDGFLQVRLRIGGRHADLVYVSPGLHAGPRAVLSWQRLLPETCHQLPRLGVGSLFVAVDSGDALARQTLQQLGFARLAQDRVYASEGAERTTASARASKAEKASDLEAPLYCRPAATEHLADLDRLARTTLPQFDAHEPGGGQWASYPMGGHRLRARSWVWLDGHGALRAGCRLCQGPTDRWMGLVVDGESGVDSILDQALRLAEQAGSGRLFTAVGSDRPALHAALRRHGFEPLADRSHFVKHHTARVLEPSWQKRQAGEQGLEAMPTRCSPPVAAAGERHTSERSGAMSP